MEASFITPIIHANNIGLNDIAVNDGRNEIGDQQIKISNFLGY